MAVSQHVAATSWFYGDAEQPLGPVPFDELRELAARGALRPEQLVRPHDRPAWVPASSVPGLFAPAGQQAAAQGLALTDAPGADTGGETPAAGRDTLAHAPATASWQRPAEGPLPPPSDLAIPGYEVLGILGRGGMGVVYQARQVQLKRLVALKMILSGQHASPEEQDRFRREAEVVARLQHPHVVQIFEIGEHAGRSYLALEYMAGGTLARRLGGRPLPPEDAARLVITLARAVQAAHELGVVHRDLKPGNVLLDAQGTPKIADFGLAKEMDSAGDRTHTGQILGTPQYMAPEQAGLGGQEVGPAADVWALGAILYELLTGRPPFQGATPLDTLDQVRGQEPVAPRRLQPKTPRDLETICLKCLHKEPRQRFAAARAVAEDLERFLAGQPIEARPVGGAERAWKWARRRPLVSSLLAFSGMALAALLGVIAWSNVRLKEANDDLVEQRDIARTKEQEARDQEQNARRQEGLAQQSAAEARSAQTLAEDRELEARRHAYSSGMNLAYQAFHLGHIDRALERLDQLRPRAKQEDLRDYEWYCLWKMCNRQRMTLSGHTGTVQAIAWSRDATVLVSGATDRTVRSWDPATGRTIHVFSGAGDGIRCLAYSPTEDLVAAGCSPEFSRGMETRILLWNPRTGAAVGELPGNAGGVRGLGFSQDGRWLAAACGDQSLRLWDVAERKAVGVFQGHTNWPQAVLFSPDGETLYSSGMDHTIRVWNVAERKQTGELRGHSHMVYGIALTQDGSTLISGSTDGTCRFWDLKTQRELSRIENGLLDVSLSPEGDFIATTGRTVALYAVADRSLHSRLPGHAGIVQCVAFAPRGGMLASGGADRTVRLWDAPRTNTALHPGHRNTVLRARFSPDGETIATASRDRTVQLWDRASGGSLRSFTEHRAEVYGLAYSPDGKWLATAGLDGRIMLRDPESGEVVFNMALNGQLLDLQFSPDSKLLAFTIAAEARVLEVPTRKSQELKMIQLRRHKAPVLRVAFSPDGTRLASASEDHKLWVSNLAKENDAVVCEGHTEAVHGVAWSPDGQTIASTGGDGTVRLWNAANGVIQKTLHQGPGVGACVAFSPDGTRLAAGWAINQGPSVLLFDLRSGKLVRSFYRDRNTLSLEFSCDSRWLLAASNDAQATLLDPETGDEVRVYNRRGRALATAVAADGALTAAGGRGWLKVFDGATQAERFSIDGPLWDVQGIAFSPDGRRLAIAETNDPERKSLPLNILDAATGEIVDSLPEHPGGALALAWSPNGRWLAIGRSQPGKVNGEVLLWDVTQRRAAAVSPALDRFVRSVAWSPDGRRLAACTADFYENVAGESFVWELSPEFAGHSPPASGYDAALAACLAKPLFTGGGAKGKHAVAFSPDGATLAVGGADNLVVLWDVEKGERRVTLEGHTNRVTALAYVGGSHRLASGSYDETVRLWDLTTRQELGHLAGHAPGVTSVAYSPLLRVLLVGGTRAESTGLTRWPAAVAAETRVPRRLGVALVSMDGPEIKSIQPDSLAALAGLRPHDVLQAIGGKRVSNFAEIVAAMEAAADGEALVIEYLREGKPGRAELALPPP